jgi:sulfite exporter TauE/SafE
VYKHAGRYVKWSIAGFVIGTVVLIAFFSTSVLVGFVGFLIMFTSLVMLWTNLSRIGKAGWHDLSHSMRGKDGVGKVVQDAHGRLRDRFKRDR